MIQHQAQQLRSLILLRRRSITQHVTCYYTHRRCMSHQQPPHYNQRHQQQQQQYKKHHHQDTGGYFDSFFPVEDDNQVVLGDPSPSSSPHHHQQHLSQHQQQQQQQQQVKHQLYNTLSNDNVHTRMKKQQQLHEEQVVEEEEKEEEEEEEQQQRIIVDMSNLDEMIDHVQFFAKTNQVTDCVYYLVIMFEQFGSSSQKLKQVAISCFIDLLYFAQRKKTRFGEELRWNRNKKPLLLLQQQKQQQQQQDIANQKSLSSSSSLNKNDNEKEYGALYWLLDLATNPQYKNALSSIHQEDEQMMMKTNQEDSLDVEVRRHLLELSLQSSSSLSSSTHHTVTTAMATNETTETTDDDSIWKQLRRQNYLLIFGFCIQYDLLRASRALLIQLLIASFHVQSNEQLFYASEMNRHYVNEILAIADLNGDKEGILSVLAPVVERLLDNLLFERATYFFKLLLSHLSCDDEHQERILKLVMWSGAGERDQLCLSFLRAADSVYGFTSLDLDRIVRMRIDRSRPLSAVNLVVEMLRDNFILSTPIYMEVLDDLTRYMSDLSLNYHLVSHSELSQKAMLVIPVMDLIEICIRSDYEQLQDVQFKIALLRLAAELGQTENSVTLYKHIVAQSQADLGLVAIVLRSMQRCGMFYRGEFSLACKYMSQVQSESGIKPNVDLLNGMISCSHNAYKSFDLLDVFMEEFGVYPNLGTFSVIIKSADSFERSLFFLTKMQDYGVEPNVAIFELLASMCLNKSNAYKLLRQMREYQVQPNEQILGVISRRILRVDTEGETDSSKGNPDLSNE